MSLLLLLVLSPGMFTTISSSPHSTSCHLHHPGLVVAWSLTHEQPDTSGHSWAWKSQRRPGTSSVSLPSVVPILSSPVRQGPADLQLRGSTRYTQSLVWYDGHSPPSWQGSSCRTVPPCPFQRSVRGSLQVVGCWTPWSCCKWAPW